MIHIKKKRRLKKGLFIVTGVIVGTMMLSVWVFYQPLKAWLSREEPISEPIIVEVEEIVLSQTDLLVLGARKDAQAMPAYVSAYYEGGYPPEDEGTCTDLVWRAFMEAGYVLKDAVDEDIINYRSTYKNIDYRDPNIDFRRVQNLKIFFERNALVLTNNIYETQEWQAGDIVIFGKSEHIGIVSDRRNENDIPYLIHNNDQAMREEDRLEYGYYTMGVTGHYRFVFPNQ